ARVGPRDQVIRSVGRQIGTRIAEPAAQALTPLARPAGGAAVTGCVPVVVAMAGSQLHLRRAQAQAVPSAQAPVGFRFPAAEFHAVRVAGRQVGNLCPIGDQVADPFPEQAYVHMPAQPGEVAVVAELVVLHASWVRLPSTW